MEKQYDSLDRIERYSQTGMESSAASVRTLDSIASSLSRIERLASSMSTPSADRESCGRKKSFEEEHRTPRSFHSTTEEYADEVTTPTVQREAWKAGAPAYPPARRQISHVRSGSDLQRAHTQRGNKSAGGKSSHIGAANRSNGVLYEYIPISNGRSPGDDLLNQPCLETQCYWNILLEDQPNSVSEYVALVQQSRIIQNQLDGIHLLLELNVSSIPRDVVSSKFDERNMLQVRLMDVSCALKRVRSRCISEGYSLYEIDQRLRPAISIEHSHKFWDSHNEPEEFQVSNRHLAKMLDDKSSVYGEWSTNRDRINHWLLHSLRSDDTQARLHRSMLADPPSDDLLWADQVLRHWYLDGAATGHALELAHSTGAVDSRELSLNEVLSLDVQPLPPNTVELQSSSGGASEVRMFLSRP